MENLISKADPISKLESDESTVYAYERVDTIPSDVVVIDDYVESDQKIKKRFACIFYSTCRIKCRIELKKRGDGSVFYVIYRIKCFSVMLIKTIGISSWVHHPFFAVMPA